MTEIMQARPLDPPTQTIIVTARALPDPASERAFGVARIGERDLRNAPSTQIDQVLKSVPGLQLFRRSDARSGHPTSQGLTLRALGGNASSRALLMLDGVPQSDPFGGWVNWPAYVPAGLAEIRIVRGGGSVANGPGTLAGTIEMTSRLDPGTVLEAQAGSRESFEGTIAASARLGGGSISLAGRAAQGDGFAPITAAFRGSVDRRAPYEEASVRALWSAPISDSTGIQLSALGFTDKRERGVPFTGNKTTGADASLRLIGRGAVPWSALGYAQWRKLSSSFASVNDVRSSANRVSLQDQVPSSSLGGSAEIRPPIGSDMELRLGGDFRRAEGESRELFSYVAGEATRRRRAGGDTVTAGLFGEIAVTRGRLSLSGGARLDRWRISDGELVEWTIATGSSLRDEQFTERSGWLPTARAGLVFDAGRGLSLRSAIYLGWRMPTLNELFRPFRAGPDATAANALLDPERLVGAEAGVRYSKGRVTLSATAFFNRLADGIANVTLAQGPGVFPGVGFVAAGGTYRQRQNLNAINVRGVEASAVSRRGPLIASLGVSFTDAEVDADRSAAELDGLRPAQTPRLAVTGGFSWESGGRAMSLVVRHVGAQFEDDLNQDKLRPATTMDAFGAWPLTNKLQLTVRAENIFDELVEVSIGSNGVIERATPRTLWFGFRFSSGH